MRKWTATALILMLCLLLAAGCASNGNNGNNGNKGSSNATNAPSEGAATDKPADKPKDPVKLTMWGGVPAESGPQAVVDAWNKEHPEIQVEYVRYVNDDAGNLKLDTALISGQSADLFVNYTSTALQKRIESGAAMDLSVFTDYSIDEKMGADAKGWQVDGKYYGVPTTKSAFFVALNKELLDEAGLEIPKSWTWDELREYANKLKGDGRYGYVSHMEPFSDPLDSVLEKDGYLKADGTSNLDDPLAVAWMSTMKAMMDEDKSMPKYGEQLTSKMPVDAEFLKGNAAILNIGAWLLRSSNNMTDYPRDFTIAFAPVPRMTENESDFISRGGIGDMISINAKSKYTAEAWEFLKWYADGGMAPMAAGGRLPASKDADADAAMKALLGDHADTYDIDSLQYVLFGNDIPTYVRSLPQQVMDIRSEEYEKFFLGAQTAEQTAANMVKRHNDFLKQK
ncbi:extracellular solute-binding protein [Paenibacillus sp. HB172176]|uniref:ABC transporter substrate-binding protein n=1 Tax=Paenibacillus sp. HB172176 TaxID=2493690 RepID=UPI001F10D647|nr:extracellular solute-binding protein [Paenibacillus sp. HB172176]